MDLPSTTCRKHFLYQGAGNNICHYIKAGVTAKCSWKSPNNEMVLKEVKVRRNLCAASEPFSEKTEMCSFSSNLTASTVVFAYLAVRGFLWCCEKQPYRGRYGVEFCHLERENPSEKRVICVFQTSMRISDRESRKVIINSFYN